MSQEELTRFTMSNIGLSEPSTVKDWDAQVSQMTKALKSATNGFVKVIKHVDDLGKAFASFDVPRDMRQLAEKVFDSVLGNIETRYGYNEKSMLQDPYNTIAKSEDYRQLAYHKVLHGADAKRAAKEAVEAQGGTIKADPSRKMKDRMLIEFAVSESDWQEALTKAGGDTVKARNRLTSAFSRGELKTADRYSKDVQAERTEAENLRKQRETEKEEKTNRRKILHGFTVATAILTAIADIARRILTAALARGSEVKKESVEAKSLGITYDQVRAFRAQEQAMGLKEGTFASGLAQLQSGVGDITNLDTNMLSELAKVLKGDVVEGIKLGLGQSNPEKLMSTILDTYFARGQQGINSAGLQVGKYQAERELATALEKAGLGELAKVLRNMFYTNDTGIYKGRMSEKNAFADYMHLNPAYTMGFTSYDNKHFAELGQVVDSVKTKFTLLKENLEKLVLNSIAGLIDKIDNWTIGKSDVEIVADDKSNLYLNQQASKSMKSYHRESGKLASSIYKKAGIDFSAFGASATAESVLEYINTKGWANQDYSSAQKAVIKQLQDFSQTEEGKEAIFYLVAGNIAKKKQIEAEDAIKEGRKSGKGVQYNRSAYTPAQIQAETKEEIAKFYDAEQKRKDTPSNYGGGAVKLRQEIPALALLRAQSTGHVFAGVKQDNKKLYKDIVEVYYGGKGITFAQALEAEDYSLLVREMHKKLPDEYKAWNRSKKADIEYAIGEGWDYTTLMRNLQMEHAGERGWGIPQGAVQKVTNATLETEADQAGYYAAVPFLTEAVRETKIAQDFMREHASETVGYTAENYNSKTGTVDVRLWSMGTDGITEKLIGQVNTGDASLMQGKKIDAVLSEGVDNAQNRSVTK